MDRSSAACSCFLSTSRAAASASAFTFPRELALERPNPLHRRQRCPPFLAQGESPLLEFRRPYALALEDIRQLGTREGARLRQDSSLLPQSTNPAASASPA